jgi:putative FmdB family regulatory protein
MEEMPIYEYKCDACGNQHEVIQKISDAPLVECPSCGQPKLRKLVSAAGFRLSGFGWYETDFKGDRKRNLAEKDSKDTKKSEQKSTSKETAKSKQGGKSSGNAKSSTSGQPAATSN